MKKFDNGYVLIDNIQELEDLLRLNESRDIECFISLNFGCRGSHTFTYFDDTKDFQHYDEVSSYLCAPKKKLMTLLKDTNVPEAIEKHAFYIHDYCAEDLKFPEGD